MPPTQFLNTFPVNPTDPVLDDMQGNILKGHGRDATFNLFLSFTPGQETNVRTWIANFSAAFVKSARQQLDETALFKSQGIPGTLFAAFFLSARGYQYLGAQAKMPTDGSFGHGMQGSGALLHDPAPATWSPGLNGAKGDIHALVLLADDDVHLVRGLARAIALSLSGKGVVVATERGTVLRNAKGDGIEHNNYVDGISQPVFLQSDLLQKGKPIPTDRWNPSAPPALALVPDPGGKDGNSLGSYFVFRKLEQNVRGFKANEAAVAQAVLAAGANPELAGAMLVGRFEGGTPVVLHGDDLNPGPDGQENNFNYQPVGPPPAGPLSDPTERRCPFQAHIRKTGPRTDGLGSDANKLRRLVRRGIPFEDKPRIRKADGNLSDQAAEQPTGGVGLLFMCYVASIPNQFEFVQSAWVDAPNFSHDKTGKDPIIGQPPAPAPGTTYQWPINWNHAATKPAPFGDFVTMRGGEYFFAPSLSMLKSLRPPAVIKPGSFKLPDLKAGPISIGDPVIAPALLENVHLTAPILFPIFADPLDPVLRLFVPDPADAGAGVVHAGPAA